MPILIPKIQKLVQVEKEKIIREQITNWLMGFASGNFETKRFNGQKITYGGVKFSGSPQHLFWGRYIEPYLEDVTERLIKEISSDCLINKLSLADELPALEENLRGMYVRVYDEMAKVEQRLLGEGYPERVPKRNVSREIADMNLYLKQHASMEMQKVELRLQAPRTAGGFKRAWSDPVWSKVISAIIIGFGVLLWGYFAGNP